MCLKDTPNYTMKKNTRQIKDKSSISLLYKEPWGSHKSSYEINFKSPFSRYGTAEM